MSNPNTDRVHGDLLREWRVSQKWDVTALASRTNLSVAQIHQLESGGTSLFYTPAIKESAARKVATVLGGDPAAVVRMLDGVSLTPSGSVVVEGLVELARHKSQSAMPASFFARSRAWLVASCSLLLIWVAWTWVQQTWASGAARPFWRESAVHWTSGFHTQLSALGHKASPAQVVPAPAMLGQAPDSTPSTLSSPSSPTSASMLAQAPAAQAAAVDAPATMRVAAVANAGNSICQQSPSGTVLTPSSPRKAADMVYIVAQKTGAVCVLDGEGKRTVLTLNESEARSVYGVPPWRVHFEQPEQAQLYFQGVRLRWPDTQVTTLALHEGPRGP